MGLLDGKAVVITGSGRGIGAACARGVARQGAAVVVNDVNAREAEATVDSIRAEGGVAVACVADITVWEEAGRLIQTCLDAFGKIDGLVNNAGLALIGKIQDLDPVAARALIDVNVLGSLYCAAHAVKPMVAQGSGSIVNVTSGAHMGLPSLSVYASSKGAVASMVYSWALELADTGVRANALSPVAGGTGMSPADPRNQPPEANSPVVEYLLSDLSSHVNGQMLRIDREELHLIAHPALLVPPAICGQWTAERIAETFAGEFSDRLIPCGVIGVESTPVPLQSGYWKRKEAQ
jgi:NAD(P)-dependent dehydrogenase (short-subunit alcohol dehydrogenase family)